MTTHNPRPELDYSLYEMAQDAVRRAQEVRESAAQALSQIQKDSEAISRAFNTASDLTAKDDSA